MAFFKAAWVHVTLFVLLFTFVRSQNNHNNNGFIALELPQGTAGADASFTCRKGLPSVDIALSDSAMSKEPATGSQVHGFRVVQTDGACSMTTGVFTKDFNVVTSIPHGRQKNPKKMAVESNPQKYRVTFAKNMSFVSGSNPSSLVLVDSNQGVIQFNSLNIYGAVEDVKDIHVFIYGKSNPKSYTTKLMDSNGDRQVTLTLVKPFGRKLRDRYRVLGGIYRVSV